MFTSTNNRNSSPAGNKACSELSLHLTWLHDSQIPSPCLLLSQICKKESFL